MKLILALDFSSSESIFELLKYVSPKHCALKVGLELFTHLGPKFVRELNARGYKVFLDLKFHDIPNTVAKAVIAAADLKVWMVNVHAQGGFDMMCTAKNALQAVGPDRPLLVAVTVLTSQDASVNLEQTVTELALLAQRAGLDGVVCAAEEVPLVKKACGNGFLTVTPGIRFLNDASHDQSRIATPEQALALGSDHLVLGRSVTQSPNPQKVISELLALISQ